MPIVYVAGFVDVVAYPKVDPVLYLNLEEVSKCLPLAKPIPLNIEHLPESTIGHTIGLYSVTHGVFCVGVINSEKFLNFAENLFSNSCVAKTTNKLLPHQPLLEILHTWLPALSLSSLCPNTQNENNDNMFQHVSLCALGRRRGTVAVYSMNLKDAISQFYSISQEEVESIYQDSKNIDLNSLSKPVFNMNPYTLMAKAIDAGFIKDRLQLLRTDKGVAQIKKLTYLKASETPKLGIEDSSEDMNQHGITSQGSDDLISVPKSTFLSMLQNNLDNFKQVTRPVFYPPYLPSQGTYVPYELYNHPPYLGENTGYMLSNGSYVPAIFPSRPNKRKREDFEDCVFPGESSLYKDVLNLTKNMSQLQDDLKDLKQAASSQPTRIIPQQFSSSYSFDQGHVPFFRYGPYGIQKNDHPPPPPVCVSQQLPMQPLHVQQPPMQAPHVQQPPMQPPHVQQPRVLPSTDVPSNEAQKPSASESVHVEASFVQDPVSQIQKLFCDELLNK
ncbi:orf 17; protease and capsid protein (N-term); minor capsid scaffold protein (C-term) [Ateline gammaherpesvirus 3]|uniref:Capsid scaffolding protein n=1 Tax=Ateline herpesvirus 3 TaxID=85618 RepID=Q9YTP9_ATHV3|nr:orf 17; protease and capsid protein (N-term); minor capsid scaffold protein (C-term) [Ateline gammaherpesvirus 3]AAC95541.1 orf 17; protease and capsid protein (N-term); minor capsid scaffold protein (C-term) [Ateline gammaherpesvirus 3]